MPQPAEKKHSSRKAWEDSAREILDASSRRLSLSLRYLFLALNRLKKNPDPRFIYTATDGEHIYYNPMKLVTRAATEPVSVNRAQMHMLMHCIFPAIRKAADYSGEERRLWDIASDIHAEYIIDGMQTPALLLPESDTKTHAYKHLTDKCGILSVENIFHQLHSESPETLALWEDVFYTDDHSPWPQMNKESRDNWDKQRAALTSTLPAYGTGKGEERLLKALKLAERKQISYKEFLKKFMRLREDPKLDPDSFDYGYYNYGLSLYGDMPLIEELETREAPSLEELIIVLDTSGSCAGDIIERFLTETLSLINDLHAISEKTRVRLLQCDKDIQSDTLISPSANVTELLSNMELKGFGGTDLRPPFQYVRDLMSSGKQISGMIYFTDGYGLYPVSRPPWKTAFIFPREPDFDDEERIRLTALTKQGSTAALRPPAWALTHTM